MILSHKPTTFVTPAKVGGHHRHSKFRRLVMDSRLRGNDEVLELEGLSA